VPPLPKNSIFLVHPQVTDSLSNFPFSFPLRDSPLPFFPYSSGLLLRTSPETRTRRVSGSSPPCPTPPPFPLPSSGYALDARRAHVFDNWIIFDSALSIFFPHFFFSFPCPIETLRPSVSPEAAWGVLVFCSPLVFPSPPVRTPCRPPEGFPTCPLLGKDDHCPSR